MQKRRSWATMAAFMFLSASVSAFAYVAGYASAVHASERSGRYPILAEVRDLLDQYHLGGLPPDQNLEYGAVRGMLGALNDPYSIFLEPPAQELETQTLQGEFGGIGVNVRRDSAGQVVLSPFPDYPAIRAGIQEGDLLTAVDTHRVLADTTMEMVSAWVRGPVNSQVQITFQRPPDAPTKVTLTRVKVEIPSVSGRILDQDRSIGLVAISRFSDKTPTETQKLIDKLLGGGAKRIILDLRDNGGGLLESGIQTAGLFLADGIIMYEDQQGQPEKVYSVSLPGAEKQLPLAVLVNHGTASAAEIVAGALRDRGRAPLIGQATYGKGSVQLIFELSDQSSVHITNARWYTPSRIKIDGAGLKPDFAIEPGTNGANPELDRAVLYLNSQK